MYGQEISLNINVGKVLDLFISEKGKSERIHKAEIYLDKEGILGDKFYAKNLQRSVLLTSIDSYSLALEHEIKMDHGMLGENILIDYNPYHLDMGVKIKIGTVILEVTQNCTICNHLSSIDKKLPKLLRDDRGIFVKVLQEGTIKYDDVVFIYQIK
ncbi:MOSC domain-containing protein [bacterium]|nr:MOSC domain-containing protein [bacterium]MBU1957835.1 MOSC domain-containing protein [bacterium]